MTPAVKVCGNCSAPKSEHWETNDPEYPICPENKNGSMLCYWADPDSDEVNL